LFVTDIIVVDQTVTNQHPLIVIPNDLLYDFSVAIFFYLAVS